MFKKIMCTILAVVATGANAGAFADTHGYFGGEVSLFNRTAYNGGSTPDLNLFKTADSDTTLAIRKNKPGLNIFAGMRFTEALGLEIGFGFIQKVSASVQNNNTATNKISNIYLDALGYLQVSSCVDLVGAIGLGVLKSKPDVSGATFTNKALLTQTKLGYRVGGGAQYYYNENWAVRAMIRYQSGNKDFLRSNTSVSVGGTYTFT